MTTTTRSLAFLIVFLFVATVAAKSEFDRQIEKLERSQFGKTLLQTIFMQLQTEDPLANLVQMLENLEAQLEAEQRKDDERLERIQSNCATDLEELQKSIGSATGLSLSLKSELDQLNPQRTAAVANLNRKIAEIQDLQKELTLQTERRERENKEFLQITDDLEGALFGINSVKTYFNNYLDKLEKDRRQFDRAAPSEGSFLQRNRKIQDEDSEDDVYSRSRDDIKGNLNLAQISNKISKIKHSVKLEGYKALVQVLSQLTSSMSQAKNEASDAEILTKKVLVVLKQIEQFIQAQRLAEEQAEQARAEAFEELKQVYTSQIVDANSEKIQMDGTVELLSNSISGASNEKFEADQKISVKTVEKSDREADCLSSQQEYDTETAKRNDQKQALTMALELITSKLGQLKKELMEKGSF